MEGVAGLQHEQLIASPLANENKVILGCLIELPTGWLCAAISTLNKLRQNTNSFPDETQIDIN